MKRIISSEGVLPAGLFITNGPTYGLGYNGAGTGCYRWLLGWSPWVGWRRCWERIT